MEQQKTNNQFLMSIDEAKKYFSIGGNKLREMVRVEPDIPIVKVGAITKIIVPEFEKFLIRAWEQGREL